MANRREFFKTLGALGMGSLLPASRAFATERKRPQELIKPQRLKAGDTVGLITPASPLFEAHQVMIEAVEKMENLGFKVKVGRNVYKKWGYLAGSDEDRLADLHEMFADAEVRAVIAVRGGYGSGRLLKHIDYDLIRNNPKIFHGYSDITSLLIGIQKMTGLVTFHGPVAVSTYTDYTKKYFYKALMETEPIGEIEDIPYDENLQTSNRVWTLKGGRGQGRLTGGNLTLIAASMGTPYEIDTQDSILFIEEVGEEPQVLDRYLTQLDNAGKLETCKGIVFDRMESVHPADYKPGYYSTLSKEEIITDRLKKYAIPCCIGLSLGHVSNKPTLPLGLRCELDADGGRLRILESGVS
ncbi:MAG: LD-carboxypeptidase [Calditrichales bacterium]|nr:MAG: LD-carboxypeptidase [Calditrichales bacterium]